MVAEWTSLAALAIAAVWALLLGMVMVVRDGDIKGFALLIIAFLMAFPLGLIACAVDPNCTNI